MSGEGIAFGCGASSLALMRKPSMLTVSIVSSVPPLLSLPFLALDGTLLRWLAFTLFLTMVFLAASETNAEGE